MSSRSSSNLLTGVSLTVLAGALCAAQAAHAQPVQLGPVQVEDQNRAYQAEQSSPKATATLRDTPQTITVVTKELIAEQNLLTLRDILTNTVPGITFTAGEGGGGYGDGITLRGFSASSDITVDGVRDSGQYNRTDPFNLEQLEVTNGANSVTTGAGSVGGNINMVSKVADFRDFTVLSFGGGTDSYGRATADLSRNLSDTVSLRLNAMVHNNSVPGRDVEKFSRYGIAPSLAVRVMPDTTVTASYVFQHDDNVPQYGVPFYRNAFSNGPLPGVDRSNYYGFANMDRQRSNVHSGTLQIDHQFTDDLSLRNLTRLSDVTNRMVVNPPQGAWCLVNGLNAANGAVCATPGFYAPSGPRGNTRITDNRTFHNQTDLRWSGMALGVQHSLAGGFAFMTEDFRLDSGNSQRDATGGAQAYPPMNIATPNNIYTGPMNYWQTSAGNGFRENQAVYLFDTITLIPELLLNVGVRYEHNKQTNNSETWTNNAYASTAPDLVNEPDLFSWRAGLIYKPVEEASVYVSYANSLTPSSANVTGIGGTACTAATCNLDPEKAQNIEIGAKWDILPNAFSIQAALFRNERTNYRVTSNDPLDPSGTQVLDGAARVDGVSLTLIGNPLDNLNLFATYTYLDSTVLRAASKFCVANPGVPDCVGALASQGNPLTATPEHAGNFWATYRIVPEVTLGYGLSVQSAYYLNNGAGTLYQAGSYTTHRLMGTYDVTDRLSLQLNVNNLFDVTYYSNIRNNGWARPSDGRSVTLTANVRL